MNKNVLGRDHYRVEYCGKFGFDCWKCKEFFHPDYYCLNPEYSRYHYFAKFLHHARTRYPTCTSCFARLPLPSECATCHQEFPSRNQLFVHLRAHKHEDLFASKHKIDPVKIEIDRELVEYNFLG